MDAETARTLVQRLQRDAERIAQRFRLEYRLIDAEPRHVKRRYGICYADGRIQIRLRHATTGKPLKYSSLVNTLCHELAHLRHFNHGARFKAFYLRLLGYARVEGIYRPGQELTRVILRPVPQAQTPRTSPRPKDLRWGPEQLPLFGDLF